MPGASKAFVVKEPLGREWSNEVVRGKWPFAKGAFKEGALSLKDSVSKKLFMAQGIETPEGVRELAVFIPQLKADQELKLEPAKDAADKSGKAVFCCEEKGHIIIGGEGFAAKLPSAKRPGAPIQSFKGVDGVWRGEGRFENAPEIKSLKTTIAVSGPVVSEVRLDYDFGQGKHLSMTVSAKAGIPAVEVDERFFCTMTAVYELDFAKGFAPDMINRRCHAVSIGRGLGCQDRDNSFRIDHSIPGGYLLQPYHAWYLDVATWWSCFEEKGGRDLIGLVMLKTSRWRRGMAVRPEVLTPQPSGVVARFRIDDGARAWALYLGDKTTDIATEPLKKPGAVHCSQIKLGNLPLEKILGWKLDHYEKGKLGTFPRIFLGKGELGRRRKQAAASDLWREFSKKVRFGIDATLKKNGGKIGLYDNNAAGEGRPAFGEIGLAIAGEKVDTRRMKSYASDILRVLESWTDSFLTRGYTEHDQVALCWSRKARDLAVQCDAFAGTGVMTESQLRRLLTLWNFLSHVTGDEDYWPRDEVDLYRGNPNFHTDMFSALAVMAGFLCDHPDAKAWLKFCEDEMRKEIAVAIGPGGVWYECPLYCYATLWWTMQGMAAIKNMGGEDFFQDEDFRRCLNVLCDWQTPPDPRCGGRAVLASVGDTCLPKGILDLQCILAWASGAVKRSSPALAAKLAEAWRRGGSPMGGVLGFQLGLSSAAPKPFHGVSRRYPEYGALIRNEDTYLLYKHGPHYQHYNSDDGSFHWYWKGVPLCLDWASQYMPSARQPWMHNRIILDHMEDGERGQNIWFSDSERCTYVVGRSTVLTGRTAPETPEELAKIPYQRLPKFEPHQATPIVWTRHLIFAKGPDFVVIWDDFQGGTGSEFCLWSLARSAKLEARNHVFFKGQYDVDLDVFFARPLDGEPALKEWGYEIKSFDWTERQHGVCAKASNKTGFLTALVPTKRGTCRPRFEGEGDAVRVIFDDAAYEVRLTADKPDGIQDYNDLHWLGLRRTLRLQCIG